MSPRLARAARLRRDIKSVALILTTRGALSLRLNRCMTSQLANVFRHVFHSLLQTHNLGGDPKDDHPPPQQREPEYLSVTHEPLPSTDAIFTTVFSVPVIASRTIVPRLINPHRITRLIVRSKRSISPNRSSIEFNLLDIDSIRCVCSCSLSC